MSTICGALALKEYKRSRNWLVRGMKSVRIAYLISEPCCVRTPAPKAEYLSLFQLLFSEYIALYQEFQILCSNRDILLTESWKEFGKQKIYVK
jgi:hypothetical protein